MQMLTWRLLGILAGIGVSPNTTCGAVLLQNHNSRHATSLTRKALESCTLWYSCMIWASRCFVRLPSCRSSPWSSARPGHTLTGSQPRDISSETNHIHDLSSFVPRNLRERKASFRRDSKSTWTGNLLFKLSKQHSPTNLMYLQDVQLAH